LTDGQLFELGKVNCGGCPFCDRPNMGESPPKKAVAGMDSSKNDRKGSVAVDPLPELLERTGGQHEDFI